MTPLCSCTNSPSPGYIVAVKHNSFLQIQASSFTHVVYYKSVPHLAPHVCCVGLFVVHREIEAIVTYVFMIVYHSVLTDDFASSKAGVGNVRAPGRIPDLF